MLDGLFAGASEDAQQRERTLSLDVVAELAAAQTAPRSASQALAPRDQIHVIAEIKRRSPSKGDLAPIVDPVGLALEYQSGGASAISVLTEQRQFGGSLEDLRDVAGASSIPVLRKDFLKTEYQIVEARAYGADWVLLILAHLSDSEAQALMSIASQWGMDALVETHSEEEVRRAVALGASIVGINARDLTTFELDPHLFGRLVSLIPEGTITIAESAVANSQDVERYREAGANAVLVGEALVTGSDPATRVREFVNS
jgi:indole-3-glycerol phosphate synthase